ncbi:BRO-N domain-containing protein [Desulfonatronum parangueonense]
MEITNSGLNLITRSDLFRLVKNSTMPMANLFWDWIIEHVLPSIHDTGTYTRVTHPNTQAQA